MIATISLAFLDAAPSYCTWRASPFLAILPTGAGSNRGKITVKVVFAYVCLVSLPVTGCPAVTEGLDGDLARLQQ